MKLDNAAKIYPAAKRRNWTALFRMSSYLKEEVDPSVLYRALEGMLPRFPGFTLCLRRGFFWFYLEMLDGTPGIQEDVSNPCIRMRLKENKRFMFRVRYYQNRISVEIFHVLTDGTGGMCFLHTLVAEYLRLKYGAVIPRNHEILDCSEPPKREETEDAFFKYCRGVTASRAEPPAYFIKGTAEPDDVIHITTGILDVGQVLAKAKEKKVTLTEYLTAALIMSIDKIQRESGVPQKRRKPVKICVPINLRKFYDTVTLRNFSSYTNPGIDSRLGDFTFDEVLKEVHHHMGFEVTEKKLNAKISTNVRSESYKILRIMPLFVKNAAMRMTYYFVGDRQTSSCLSNLGAVRLPDEMSKYVDRVDFMLGPLSRNRVVLAVGSYQDKLYINFTRTIAETKVEREFFRFLVREGLHVMVESNQTAEEGENLSDDYLEVT